MSLSGRRVRSIKNLRDVVHTHGAKRNGFFPASLARFDDGGGLGLYHDHVPSTDVAFVSVGKTRSRILERWLPLPTGPWVSRVGSHASQAWEFHRVLPVCTVGCVVSSTPWPCLGATWSMAEAEMGSRPLGERRETVRPRLLPRRAPFPSPLLPSPSSHDFVP